MAGATSSGHCTKLRLQDEQSAYLVINISHDPRNVVETDPNAASKSTSFDVDWNENQSECFASHESQPQRLRDHVDEGYIINVDKNTAEGKDLLFMVYKYISSCVAIPNIPENVVTALVSKEDREKECYIFNYQKEFVPYCARCDRFFKSMTSAKDHNAISCKRNTEERNSAGPSGILSDSRHRCPVPGCGVRKAWRSGIQHHILTSHKQQDIPNMSQAKRIKRRHPIGKKSGKDIRSVHKSNIVKKSEERAQGYVERTSGKLDFEIMKRIQVTGLDKVRRRMGRSTISDFQPDVASSSKCWSPWNFNMAGTSPGTSEEAICFPTNMNANEVSADNTAITSTGFPQNQLGPAFFPTFADRGGPSEERIEEGTLPWDFFPPVHAMEAILNCEEIQAHQVCNGQVDTPTAYSALPHNPAAFDAILESSNSVEASSDITR